MRTSTALEALARRPASFLRSSWPWRALAYLLASAVPGGVVIAVGLAASLLGSVPTAAVAVAVAAVPLAPLAARYERWRLRLVDLAPPAGAGAAPRRAAVLGAVSLLALWWIDLAVACLVVAGPAVLVLSPVLQPTDEDGALAAALAVSAAGLLLLPVAAYVVTAWAGARGAAVRALLAPDELAEVLRSRARLVDAYETERRRIERDLHDGAQQRLVALSMRLGLALLDLPPGSPAAGQVALAQEEAQAALAELRELIRGVHPQVLTDRGLAAAVRDVAGRSPVPVDVDVRLPRRLPGAVETAAYYVVAEALANVARHSRAERARVRGRLAGDVLALEVRDDGAGGADPARGSGVAGLADRVAAVGGRLSLSSPPGGPTTMSVEIPCAW
uniref:sensor histidine kinase n=1 Tax=Nonomuraea pusilla TaxID=46177 RepID=UPI0006E32DBA|nr:histidine kinase [Nonomuraea pusilla]